MGQDVASKNNKQLHRSPETQGSERQYEGMTRERMTIGYDEGENSRCTIRFLSEKLDRRLVKWWRTMYPALLLLHLSWTL